MAESLLPEHIGCQYAGSHSWLNPSNKFQELHYAPDNNLNHREYWLKKSDADRFSPYSEDRTSTRATPEAISTRSNTPPLPQ
jgi:hypothetical protein